VLYCTRFVLCPLKRQLSISTVDLLAVLLRCEAVNVPHLHPEGGSIGKTYSGVNRRVFTDLTEVRVILRPTVNRPTSGRMTNFYFSLKFSLDNCGFVILWLPLWRVCNLLLLLGFASAVPLGSESHGTQDHILLSQCLRLAQHGGPGPRIYIPQERGGPVMPSGTGFRFRRLLRLTGLREKYSNPPPHGDTNLTTSRGELYIAAYKPDWYY
jgi:hypothetical protein